MLKVSITPQDNDGAILGSPVVLCESPDPLPTHNVRINGQPILQVVPYLQSESVRVFDRGNRRLDFSFEVKRGKNSAGTPFPGPATALAFALDQCGSEADCPHFGLVRIEMSDETASLIRFLDRAGCSAIALTRLQGVSLAMGYQIIGGKLLKQLPTS